MCNLRLYQSSTKVFISLMVAISISTCISFTVLNNHKKCTRPLLFLNDSKQQQQQQPEQQLLRPSLLEIDESPKKAFPVQSFSSCYGRRQAMTTFFCSIASSAAVFVVFPKAGEATYSAYTRREQDWQQRLENGEVNVKTARDLRRQLAEIAPMNSESSRIFCPNGPSAAVSPLMENKCGDRLALPSVYGRTADSVGNSIPGFESTYVSGGMVGPQSSSSTSNLAAELQNVGYGFTNGRKQ